MNLHIRKAYPADSAALTALSFAAKRYWNYPEEYFDIWKEELTITPEYIQKHLVYTAEVDGELIGYASVVEVQKDFWAGKLFVQKGFWLEHLFIHPSYIGRGLGTKLMAWVENVCGKQGIKHLLILSDPHARGFYDKMGCQYVQECPSSIEGRTVSLYIWKLS